MKLYYYFLFRLYRQLELKYKDEKVVMLLTTTTSSFLLCFALMEIYLFFSLFIFPISFKGLNMASFVVIPLLVGYLNFFFFIKRRSFLNFNFKQDKYGGYYIFLFIIVLFTSFILLANISRDRIINKEIYSRMK